MTNKELREYLRNYPDDMPIKVREGDSVVDFEEWGMYVTSETAHVDESFPEEEWDHEDGKVVLGDGEQYLLLNPLVI